MNKSKKNVLSALGLAAALVTTFLVGRASADQPHMHKAKEHLLMAKDELKSATDDKGGHRVKAIRAVDDALDQVDKGIKFDRRH